MCVKQVTILGETRPPSVSKKLIEEVLVIIPFIAPPLGFPTQIAKAAGVLFSDRKAANKDKVKGMCKKKLKYKKIYKNYKKALTGGKTYPN